MLKKTLDNDSLVMKLLKNDAKSNSYLNIICLGKYLNASFKIYQKKKTKGMKRTATMGSTKVRVNDNTCPKCNYIKRGQISANSTKKN